MTGRLGQEMLLVHHMMPRITDHSCSQTALARVQHHVTLID